MGCEIYNTKTGETTHLEEDEERSILGNVPDLKLSLVCRHGKCYLARERCKPDGNEKNRRYLQIGNEVVRIDREWRARTTAD